MSTLQDKHSLNIGELEACYGPLISLPIWSGHVNKIPNNGQGNISVTSPLMWKPLPEVLETQQGTAGVCLNLTDGVRVTDAETGEIHRLVGIDVDKVSGPIELIGQLNTYVETSPSGHGLHAFCFAPEEWARQHRDTVKIALPNCHHAEVYLGSGARHLTVTFEVQGIPKPIRILDDAALAVLGALLKPADSPSATPPKPPIVPGNPLDLSQYKLKPDHRKLIDGAGQPEIDRSAVVHSFLMALAEQGVSREDALATMLQEPALWGYCLEHRHDDETRAAEFAEKEVERAWKKSKPGMMETMAGPMKVENNRPDPTWPVTKAEAPQADAAPADAAPADAAEDRAALVAALAAAAANAAPAAANAAPAAAAPATTAPALGLVSAADLVKKAGPIDWLIRGYIEADTIAQIFGPPGHYKSFAAIDIATAVGSGQDWHGHPVRQGAVVYVCGEGHNGIARRLQALCQERGIDPATLPLMFSPAAIGLSDVGNAALLKKAIDALPEPPVLIIVDTLARNFGAADENSTPDMNAFIANIDALRGDATVLVIHHTGHTNTERERGSSALRGAIDANYKVEFRNDHHAVCIEPLKMKDAELPPPLFLIPKIVVLPLLDEEGQPVTSVVLDTSKDQQLARITEFYKKHPDLGSGERRQNLPKLLEKIIDNPEISQKKLADETGISAGGVNTLVKILRKYKLMGEDLQLTDAGMKAAATLLIGRLDIIYTAFGISPKKTGKV